jgi:uncharacterized protein
VERRSEYLYTIAQWIGYSISTVEAKQIFQGDCSTRKSLLVLKRGPHMRAINQGIPPDLLDALHIYRVRDFAARLHEMVDHHALLLLGPEAVRAAELAKREELTKKRRRQVFGEDAKTTDVLTDDACC